MERNIELFSGENLGGGLSFEFTRIENLREPLVVVNGYVTQDIALKENALIYIATMDEDYLGFTSSPVVKHGKEVLKNILKAKVPRDSAENRVAFFTQMNNRYLVIYTDANGQRSVMGDYDQGCKFSYRKNHGSSKRGNFIDFEFSYVSRFELPIIKESVPTALVPKDDATHDLDFEPFG